MTGRERVRALLSGAPADRPGFWLGNPADGTKRLYAEHLGIGYDTAAEAPGSMPILSGIGHGAELELGRLMGNDLHWCSPELDPSSWRHPEGGPMWDFTGGKPRTSLNQPGVFAEAGDTRTIESYDWPDPAYLDFGPTAQRVDAARKLGMAVFGGMWMPFFHILCDLFGMDNYFVKMHTDPAVVEAATERTVDFYLEANRRCLDEMGDRLDAVFFGNDLGSQLDLLISPEMFERFVLPGFRRIIDQAKSYGLPVALHACGSITRIIPALIDAGVDALHPLQAKARGMDAENLRRMAGDSLVFIGGVDTQQLLPFGTPAQVADEVERLTAVLGERYIVSPSHEALLPNVPFENAAAMRDAALLTRGRKTS